MLFQIVNANANDIGAASLPYRLMDEADHANNISRDQGSDIAYGGNPSASMHYTDVIAGLSWAEHKLRS